MNFSELDKMINSDAVNEELQKQTEYETVPDGEYIVRFNDLVIGGTKEDNRPILKICVDVVDVLKDEECYDFTNNTDAQTFFSKYSKGKLFMNRVLFGTKSDARVIASAVAWLSKLDGDIEFSTYTKLSEDVAELFNKIKDKYEYHIVYEKSKFNSISIKQRYDI